MASDIDSHLEMLIEGQSFQATIHGNPWCFLEVSTIPTQRQNPPGGACLPLISASPNRFLSHPHSSSPFELPSQEFHHRLSWTMEIHANKTHLGLLIFHPMCHCVSPHSHPIPFHPASLGRTPLPLLFGFPAPHPFQSQWPRTSRPQRTRSGNGERCVCGDFLGCRCGDIG